MNRRQLLTTGLIGTAALLGACSVGNVETSGEGEGIAIGFQSSTTVPKAQGAPVTIALVSSGLDGPRLTVQIQQVIQDLHARGKAVDLTHTLISPRAQGGPTALVETIDAAVSDGRHIDLMFVTNPEQLEGMYKLDRLLPVDEISRSDSGFSVDGYFPAAMQTVTFDGRAMGLPLWFRPITMSVNRQAFADAGVEIPAGDWDWHLSRNRPAPHQT
jgi:ABC-type glycerol-3-phosphate transport system substrate-binding protein